MNMSTVNLTTVLSHTVTTTARLLSTASLVSGATPTSEHQDASWSDNYTAFDVNVYKCSNRGLLLPLINEYTWPVLVRAAIYFTGMIYCFLGVSIIADVFMCSIEKITSRTRSIRIASPEAPGGYDKIEVKVWNDAIANLTLMALGTSSPEILLSIIETVGNKFVAGELGAGTIVGSAAFNLHIITALCVVSIASPDIRRITNIKVFVVTTIFSIFAYLWLIVVLIIITPDVVDLWEAVLTFLFFPILVITAYVVDRNFFRKPPPNSEAVKKFAVGADGDTTDIAIPLTADQTNSLSPDQAAYYMKNGKMSPKQMRDFVKHLRKTYPNLTDDEVAKLASAKVTEEQSHDRLWYRINATRQLTGGHGLQPALDPKLQDVYDRSVKNQVTVSDDLDESRKKDEGGVLHDVTNGGSIAVVEFKASNSAVLEKEGKIRVGIKRYGKLDCAITVRIETIDGTAEANSDYLPMKDTLTFSAGETEKLVDIGIIDDNEWEPDECFFVKLALPMDVASTNMCLIGSKSIHQVTIIDDDKPGVFEFAKPTIVVTESTGKVELEVVRKDGADGRVEIKWETNDGTAIGGKDYVAASGVLVFEHGETVKTIDINIIDDAEFEKDEHFRIELLEIVTPGAQLGRNKRTMVTIVNDDDFNSLVNRLVNKTNMNLDALRVDSVSWGDQFRNAMNVNNGDIEAATTVDYVLHFLSFGWKVMFAFVPPTSICGGWLSFICALSMIGFLTAIIGDLAAIFGCLVGLSDTITAITFVAVGTSVPDLFASKTAASQEKTADNSIGNVTGSNSVNVFLGMGLPWLLASIYWTAQGEVYKVPAGSLGFSVVLFTITALVTLGTLALRHNLSFFGKGELGGPKGPKLFTGFLFVVMWLVYIVASIVKS